MSTLCTTAIVRCRGGAYFRALSRNVDLTTGWSLAGAIPPAGPCELVPLSVQWAGMYTERDLVWGGRSRCARKVCGRS